MFERMARCIRRAILNVYLGSEPTSAAQNRNVFSLPVEGPLPKIAPNRFTTAANDRNPPFATLSVEKVVENELGFFRFGCFGRQGDTCRATDTQFIVLLGKAGTSFCIHLA
jgi:hypothetical protein